MTATTTDTQFAAFAAELLRAQTLVALLETLGADASGAAAEVGGIARRGAELLARLTDAHPPEGESWRR